MSPASNRVTFAPGQDGAVVDDQGQPVRVGVLLPTREMAITGSYAMTALIDFAREAERLGFDSLWAGDSLTARPRLDPLIVLAAVAAITERVTLGTAALTAVLRNPLIGANMITSLDHASGSRLAIGLGSGFPVPESADEFAAVGVPFTDRVRRLDETARLWRAAWRSRRSPGAASFNGRYWQVTGLDRLPPPAAAAGPPLWLAGSDTPSVLSRVASMYDGWLPFLPTAGAYRNAWGQIGELARRQGRPAGSITPALYVTVHVDENARAAKAELERYVQAYYRRPLEEMATIQAYHYGTATECADWLGGYLKAGARHIVIRIGSLTPAAQLTEIANVLLPSLRGMGSPAPMPE
jgi:alkanesulfonate monooxygenase SsuD/methylene tetrahydromethanopterin reductase-like flavin-dependent oxidoreductase (luciferase family)